MSSSTPCKRIVITPGEPAGIGPDLVIELLQQPLRGVELVVVADEDLLLTRARQLGKPLQIESYQQDQGQRTQRAGVCRLLNVPLAAAAVAGVLNQEAAPYVLQTLDRAIDGCLQGEFAALVTGPVHKGIINDAGIPFTGHTEYLAQRCGVKKVVMMLASPRLRVALVTTHLPLKDVAQAITRAEVATTIQIVHNYLEQQGKIKRGKIMVAGLNPHAGENGYLGSEEIEIISPVISELQASGINVHGPYPADTMFCERNLADTDAFIAMYHDQGLPVLKHASFGQAANITLGLPVIRTSVDHGVALALAGTGKASASSLKFALQTAVDATSPLILPSEIRVTLRDSCEQPTVFNGLIKKL